MGTHPSNLTQHLGPPNYDDKYMLGDIYYHRDGPEIFYPYGKTYSKKIIDIRLGDNAVNNLKLSLWQLAHESVHLFDPSGFINANYLEEGIATWYQMKIYSFPLTISKYQLAKDLVEKHSGVILPGVKKLRSQGYKINSISVQQLQNMGIGMSDADKLAQRFNSK